MKFLTVYRDPKKKRLQQFEVLLLLLCLPVVAIWGSRSLSAWSNFRQAETLFQAGDAHLHKGELSEATTLFEQCVELYPDFYGAWEGLGASYHLLGQHDEELSTYQRAVEAIPTRGELYRELATAHHEAGDHKKEHEFLLVAQQMLGTEEVFTRQLLDRAERELAGTYPAEPDGLDPLEHLQQMAQPTPQDGQSHDHSGHDHDHEGHDHSH